MVIAARRTRSYWPDTSGLAMTEALIVLPLLLLVMAASIEMSVAMFQWSQTVKAMQIGARLAVVSDPVTDISSLSVYPSGSQTGDPISSTATPVVCGAGATACNVTEMTRLYNGGDACGVTTTGLVGICDVAPFIGINNLRVTYTRSNLGYVDRPGGPVVTVTLETRNLFFNFLVLDDLMRFFQPLGVPAGIAVPPHRVAITSEDLCSEDAC